jgi:hypothetical protein
MSRPIEPRYYGKKFFEGLPLVADLRFAAAVLSASMEG